MRWILVVVAGVVLAVGLIWISQRRLIYFPTQPVPDAALAGPSVEAVTFRTDDGVRINAWFWPASGEQSGAVIVFNGNAGNRSHRIPLARALVERGFAVLLVDYRGYGGNDGSPSEEGLASDARAALGYMESRPDVDPDRIAYFGESLGAGVAVGLAAEQPPAALVLRSPFTSLSDVGSAHYPFLPVSLMLWDRYPVEETIGDVGVSLLVIAGSADTIVPTEQSQAVFDAASGPKTLVIIEGADHNDYSLTAGDQLIDETVRFLLDAFGSSNP